MRCMVMHLHYLVNANALLSIFFIINGIRDQAMTASYAIWARDEAPGSTNFAQSQDLRPKAVLDPEIKRIAWLGLPG